MNAYYEHLPQKLSKDTIWKYPNAVKIYIYLKQRAEAPTYTYSGKQEFTICSYETLTNDISENGKRVSKNTIKKNVDKLVKQQLIKVEKLSYGSKFIIL
jgi:Fe2+ or Zn2+ uptake regulation protein